MCVCVCVCVCVGGEGGDGHLCPLNTFPFYYRQVLVSDALGKTFFL